MKRYLSYFGNVLVIIAIIFLVSKLFKYYNQLGDLSANATGFMISILFIFFVLATFLMSVYVWKILLIAGNVHINLREAYIIVGRTQIAKYLPGNIFHFVGRIAVGNQHGLPTEPIILSMGVETFLNAASAGLISLLGLFVGILNIPLLSKLPISGNIVFPWTIIAFCIIALVILFLTSKRIRGWIFERLSYLHPKRAVIALCVFSFVFLSFGILINLLVDNLIGMESNLHWYQYSSGFTLAWFLGFITPGAPGGIGIREAVFVGLFGKELGEGLAVGLAVVLRVITSISDLITFGIASWLGNNNQISSPSRRGL